MDNCYVKYNFNFIAYGFGLRSAYIQTYIHMYVYIKINMLIN